MFLILAFVLRISAVEIVQLCVRSWYVGPWKVITPHNLLRDFISYGCPRYLLLSTKSSIVQSCSKDIRHVFMQIDMTLKGYNPDYESWFADRFAISERINVITTNIKVSKSLQLHNTSLRSREISGVSNYRQFVCLFNILFKESNKNKPLHCDWWLPSQRMN